MNSSTTRRRRRVESERLLRGDASSTRQRHNWVKAARDKEVTSMSDEIWFEEPPGRFYYRLVRGTLTHQYVVDLMHERQFTPEEFQRLCLHALVATHGGAVGQVADYLAEYYGFEIIHPLVCHLYDLSPGDGRGVCGIYDDQGQLLVRPIEA